MLYPSTGLGRQWFCCHAVLIEASFTASRFRLNAISEAQDATLKRVQYDLFFTY